mgnify:CR=1 FL=1
MENSLYIEPLSQSREANDANATHRDLGNGGEYFFSTKTDSLHQGRISVTHTSCVDPLRGDSGESRYELNRRQTCLRASKLSLPSASSQLSQLAAASKKKKWLLLSQWSKSQCTANSKTTFAGRTLSLAPQNPPRSALCVEHVIPEISRFRNAPSRCGRACHA